MNIIRHQRRRCHKNTCGKNELGKKGKLTEEENQMCCLRPRVMVISWQQSQEKEKEKQKVMTHMRR
jgi:hypothetical protein